MRQRSLAHLVIQHGADGVELSVTLEGAEGGVNSRHKCGNLGVRQESGVDPRTPGQARPSVIASAVPAGVMLVVNEAEPASCDGPQQKRAPFSAMALVSTNVASPTPTASATSRHRRRKGRAGTR